MPLRLASLLCVMAYAHAYCGPGLSPGVGGVCVACAAGTHKPYLGSFACSQCGAGKFSGRTEDRIDASALQAWLDEGITQWVHGDAGQSCDDACAAVDSYCVDPVNSTGVRKMPQTVTDAIFMASGANCLTKRTSTSNLAPYSDGTNCYRGIADERALCSLARENAERLCACNASKANPLVFRFAPSAGIYSGAATCTDCATGTRSTAGSAFCALPCLAGTYHLSDAGVLACVACDRGTYSDGGATVCLECPAGTYGTSSGSRACVACAADTQQAMPGSVACIPCQDGFASVAGSAGCVPRPVCPGGDKSMLDAVAAVLLMPCSVDAMLAALLVPGTRLLSGPHTDVLQSFVAYYVSRPAGAMPKACTDVYLDVIRKLQHGAGAAQDPQPVAQDPQPAAQDRQTGGGQCARLDRQLAAALVVFLLSMSRTAVA